METPSAADRPTASPWEPAEYERTLDEFGPRLRSVALGILGSTDDADDACQEAFLTLWRDPPIHREPGAVFCWLRRVVTNQCLNRLRRKRPLRLADAASHNAFGDSDDAMDPAAQVADPTAVDPAERSQTTELAAVCRNLMSGLSDQKRAVLALRVLEEMSYEEIAESMGCSLGTVMSRLHRARQELLSRLREAGLYDHVAELAAPPSGGRARARHGTSARLAGPSGEPS